MDKFIAGLRPRQTVESNNAADPNLASLQPDDDRETATHGIREFAHNLEELGSRVERLIAAQPIRRTPKFRSNAVTLDPGQTVTIAEDIQPDLWVIVVPNVATATVQVYPSAGQPNAPDAFEVGAGGSIKLPAISQYLSIFNDGPVTVTVYSYALIGYDFDYEPLQSASGGAGGSVVVTNFPATQAVTGTFWQATQAVSGTFWQATQPVSGTFWQATQPVSGTFWQATQPVSISTNKLATAAFMGQVTVAATQTVLSATHALQAGYVRVKALKTNVGNVMIGITGVAATTGDVLEPGDVGVYPISDPALLFCIGTAADKISWYAS